MEALNKVTLIYAGWGAIAGCISSILFNGGLALLLAIFLFYVSYKLIPLILKIKAAEFPGGKRKIATTGVMPFFIMWLILWILVYSLILTL